MTRFSALCRSAFGIFRRSGSEKQRSLWRKHRLPLRLETLEDRWLPSTLMVTNLNDDTNPGSLRSAITQANVDTGDVIQFTSGLTGTITLTSALPTIKAPMTITGPAAAVTISGNNATRIFSIDDSTTTSIRVSISGLTLTQGSATGGGGAIQDANENVTLNNMVVTANKATTGGGGLAISAVGGVFSIGDSTITNNTTTGGPGGGVDVAVPNGSVLLQNSTVSGNKGATNGGGVYIFASGNLTVQNSTISGNSVTTTGGRGGGLYFFGTGTLLVQNSTVSGNHAADAGDGPGGGLDLRAFSGTALIQNSTFGNNTAGGNGGGIDFASGTGALTILNSTIAFNTSDNDANGTGKGGGLSVAAGTGTVQVISTIVAKNTDKTAAAPDIDGTVVASYSLVQNTTGAVLGGLTTNITGQDPMLMAAGNNDPLPNGGPTATYAIPLSSPAINKGFNPSGLATDQRGSGFPRISGIAPDIGAFELTVTSPTPTVLMVTNTNDDTNPGSLRTAITQANVDNMGDVIQFAAGVTGTITLTSALPTITAPMTITGPGPAAVTISGNNATRIFTIDNAATTAIRVSISGLTLTQGSATGQGGAILNADENVTLNNMVVTANKATTGGGGLAISAVGGVFSIGDSSITNNTTTGGPGGGVDVANLNGSVLLQNSTVSGNKGATRGGGVYIDFSGNLTVQNSTISGNSVTTTGGRGGGLYFFGTGTLLVQNSTVSGNHAADAGDGPGGGLELLNFSGMALIQNSTFGNNTAGGNGGGIRYDTGTGALTILNSTIAFNTSDNDANGTGKGGGLSVAAGTGTVQVISTIVAKNTDKTAAAPDIDGTVVASFSLVQTTTGAVLGGLTTNITGQDPMLVASASNDPLSNGGPTATYAIPLSSPAINKGFNPSGLATDQRGPGFPRISGVAPDIGAFEFTFPPAAIAATSGSGQSAPINTAFVNPLVATVTDSTGNPLQGIMVTFAAPGTGASVTFPGGATVTTNAQGQASVNVTANGTAGSYTVTATAAGLATPANFSLTNITAGTAPAITSPNTTTFVVGTAGTFTVTTTGTPTPTLSESGALPAGVTFNTTTGVLSGTPAAGTAGSYPITFTAGNGVSPDATQNFTLVVSATATKPFNFDKLGAYRASNGSWSLDSDGTFGFNGATDQVFFSFSPPGAVGVAGDWTGTGRDNIGDFSNGVWHLDLNGNGVLDAGETFNFGQAGDKPVVGDWTGDGKSKLGVFRTASDGITGLFILDTNNNRQLDSGDLSFTFGFASDRIVVGDWVGDGISRVGVFRDAASFIPADAGDAVFSLDTNNNHVFDAGDQVFVFGLITDGLVIGNWNGVGPDKVGVYRDGSNGFNAPGVALFSLDLNGNLQFDASDSVFLYGFTSDQFVGGDWVVTPPLQPEGTPQADKIPPSSISHATNADLGQVLASLDSANQPGDLTTSALSTGTRKNV